MTIEVTHQNEVIRYEESNNKWEWGGRDYVSLSGAKRAIEKLSAVDFPPLPCLVRRWGKWYVGEITSRVDTGSYWVMVAMEGRKSDRRIAMSLDLYADSPENQGIVQRSEELLKKADDLHREANELISTLTPVFFPAE